MLPGPRLAPLAIGAAFAALLSPAALGQFNQQPSVIPGGAVFSSGIMTFDADGDGDLDVFVSNGDGFGSAGTKRLPSLYMNQGLSGGNPNFLDQAGSRLPNITLNAKGALAFDMENDGDLDIFISVAFGQSQKLYRNNGSGIFTDVTAALFTTTNINSWGANAFDMDNDGDRDLAVCDNTGSSLNSNGRMRLFENDGTGDFTEVTNSNTPNINKSSQQNVTAVDLDNDMDLDLVLDGRSTPQRAYINDGTGNFTNQNGLIPSGSSSCYETDWTDLDGDGDVDGFYISYSGFNEGTAKNNLIGAGTGFTGSTGTIIGTNGSDDNEVLFIDYDDDGDLDPIVSALGQSREKLYRNNGNFTFTYTNTFSAQSDSTLDMTCGDYDGDGDYDVITAQGESGNFTNRYYRNDGPTDTTKPNIWSTLVTDSTGPIVILTRVSDGTMDDGDQFVDCDLVYTITPLTGPVVNGSVAMRYSGGQIYRGEISSGLPANLFCATVAYHIVATDGAGNIQNSPTSNFLAGGAPENYGTGEFGSGGTQATMGFTGTPSPNGNFAVTVSGANPNSFTFFLCGDTEGFNTNPAWGIIYVAGPNFLRLTTSTTGAGTSSVSIPVTAAMVGTARFYQYVTRDPGFGGNIQAADGLKVVFYP